MSLDLAVPEHAVRNRITLSISFLLFAAFAGVSAGADEHGEAAEANEASEPAAEVVDVAETETETETEVEAAEDPEAADAAETDETTEADEVEAAAEEATSEAPGDDGAVAETATDDEPIEELTPHSAEYRVKISVLSGRLNTSLVRTDDGYEANHRIRPTGLARMVSGGSIEEFSSFENTVHGIVPIHYVSNDSLTRDKTRANVDFDWDTNTITGTVNDQPVEIALEEFAHNRVSTQYQLMRDLMNDALAERYVLFDIDEIKILNVSTIGEREIRVPAGTFTALGVQHQAEGSSRVTTLWCVEELDYLPVMIEQHRRGELRMRASLRDYAPIGD